MYKRILVATALCLCVMANAIAQEISPYEAVHPWVASPVLHKIPEEFKGKSAVFLMDSRTHHYKTEGKNIFQFNYVYKLIKVQDDKGIEMFNKIYLQYYRNSEISDIKARVITSSGKVINVPADKIKQEEEDGNLYKLFAMEGIDKGSEIEYSYTIKKNPSFFGSEIFNSPAVPYYKARLLIITPKHLQFDAKGFNGFTVTSDSLLNDERYISGFSKNIKELGEEKYGMRDPYLQRAEFKLSYNLSQNNDVELYTWKEFARKAYGNIASFSPGELKAVAKFLDKGNFPASLSEEKTIMMLEDFMKTRINIDEKLVSEGASDIEVILKSGNANNFGSVRLLACMLENKNIDYQAVFPSVRNQVPLDEELANWNRIDETLLYFPGTGKFVEPSGATVRYPVVDPYWAGTRGLFIKPTSIGGVKTGFGRFADISILPLEQNAHDMEVNVKLDAVTDSLIIESKQILLGYGAIPYRPIWAYLPKDKQDEAIKSIIQSVAKSENISNIKCEGTKLTDTWDNKPLIIGGTIHTAELIEKAGNKILFKIGELIGQQAEMYQEKERQLPAEVAYAHTLGRKITFEIPAGYSIKNPESLIIDVRHEQNNLLTMGFVSSYKITANVLEVNIMETYRDLKYPMSQFETFKKVINAAADFNKIVLVLEKKA